MGLKLDAAAPTNWGVAMLVMLSGVGMFEIARRRFAVKWGDTQQAIEIDLKRREAV
jgi:branched-chain amino acid transport system permease protein